MLKNWLQIWVTKLITQFITKTFTLFIFRNKTEKINNVLKFKQSDWMKIYIDFNTEKRKNAANSLEKKLF